MYPVIKRFFDILFALLALIILSPLLIPIVIGLKLTGEGHVFYLQERVGYRNRLFNIYKFATMLKDSPNMKGGIITTAKDPRITPMGGFLRKSKINELPQLLNVLFGDMSFVGPRPVMQKSFDQYPESVQAVIYNVHPGITGIGSIVFRDEEQLITEVRDRGEDTWAYYRDVIYPHKGRVEEWYQANQSFWVDLKILFLTAWVILQPDSDMVYRAFPEVPVFTVHSVKER
ncbi:lipopolysaccharide/colanic/teichoic acid biosynthesis glycosyltransferase [Lewinella aquimaris]|uniref:Lipopolysaccharide/colanic/teichoic acid biosynthesis glycosyltransferase n=1 Tax=Neolewinella aquimaris TaxID=1835722 RepID=A0A840EEI7_9BACT|nr:sugar transferase [Neolewinella aquimaris]MBB4080219.1 lipopolysaccharide/colanic/teichoic acid biosynthesis glycosyltransferase [Neolewinella aquimaris]